MDGRKCLEQMVSMMQVIQTKKRRIINNRALSTRKNSDQTGLFSYGIAQNRDMQRRKKRRETAKQPDQRARVGEGENTAGTLGSRVDYFPLLCQGSQAENPIAEPTSIGLLEPSVYCVSKDDGFRCSKRQSFCRQEMILKQPVDSRIFMTHVRNSSLYLFCFLVLRHDSSKKTTSLY